MQRRFRRSIDVLEEIAAFVAAYAADNGIDDGRALDVTLVIEELFTNLVKYNKGRHDIAVGLERIGDKLAISLTDFDVEPFDVTLTPEVDTDLPVESRRPGGLGIHFVKRIAERLSFEHKDGNSTTTVIVGLGG